MQNLPLQCECGAMAHRAEEADGSLKMICPVCVVHLGTISAEQLADLNPALQTALKGLQTASGFIRGAARSERARPAVAPIPMWKR